MNLSPRAVMETMYDETGSHEHCPRKGRPRVASVAEDSVIRVTSLRNHKLTSRQFRAQINVTRVLVADTSPHQLLRGDARNQIFMIQKLLIKTRLRKSRRHFFGPKNTRIGHESSGNLIFSLMSPILRSLDPTALLEEVDKWSSL